MTVSKELQDKLIHLAKEAQKKSYSPYSKFQVGAAVLTEDGDIFTGCNVENISYGLTCCGERTAIFKMASEKGPHVKIKGIAVTSNPEMSCAPCGACRQVIKEFSTGDTLVIYKGQHEYISMSIDQLLPGSFTEFAQSNQDGSSTLIQSGM